MEQLRNIIVGEDFGRRKPLVLSYGWLLHAEGTRHFGNSTTVSNPKATPLEDQIENDSKNI